MSDLAAFVKKYLVALVIGALLLFAGGTCWRLRAAQSAARAQAFKADSAIAAADTTRAVNDRAKKILGDSVRGVERRAWQAEIQRDALDNALRRVTAAKANVTVSLKDLRALDSGTVSTDSHDVRTSSFAVDSVPFHVRADVALPPAPRKGVIDLSVRVDPARIGARVQCGKAKDAGVRPATLTVTTPAWLTAQIDSPQFSPDVCNAQKAQSKWWLYPATGGVGFLLGMVLSR